MRLRFPILLLALVTSLPLHAAKPGAAQADGTLLLRKADKSTLRVAAESSPDELSWQDAVAFCKASTAHGQNDWRLPDMQELRLMYAQRERIGMAVKEIDYNSPYAYLDVLQTNGGMQIVTYWCSTRDGSHALLMNFADGKELSRTLEENVHAPLPPTTAKARCVRSP